jgi:hypothetical protein
LLYLNGGIWTDQGALPTTDTDAVPIELCQRLALLVIVVGQTQQFTGADFDTKSAALAISFVYGNFESHKRAPTFRKRTHYGVSANHGIAAANCPEFFSTEFQLVFLPSN